MKAETNCGELLFSNREGIELPAKFSLSYANHQPTFLLALPEALSSSLQEQLPDLMK
jgi:hypothetical protein